MLIKELTRKERILTFLLLAYTGGFGYFWGMATNDLYLIIVFTFLFSQFVGGRILINVILESPWTYRIGNGYVRLLINFAVNVALANIVIPIIKSTQVGNLDEFLAGPIVYGVAFAILYYIYLTLTLKKIV